MKKFTKLFLSCAIVSAVVAASATMAFADDPASYPVAGSETLAGTYTVSSNDITGLTLGDTVKPDANTQVTFLVYKAGSDETAVSADNVIGIDQFSSGADQTVQPTNKGLKANSVKVPQTGQNKYIVKVGYYQSGTFKTATASFVTGQAAGNPVLLGEVTGGPVEDGAPDSADAVAILNFDAGSRVAGKIANAGKTLTIVDFGADVPNTATSPAQLGDVTGDGAANSADAVAILNFDAGSSALNKVMYAGKVVTGEVSDTVLELD